MARAEPLRRLRAPLAAGLGLLAALGTAGGGARAQADAAPRRFERIELRPHQRVLGAVLRELDPASPGPELLLASAEQLGPNSLARHLGVYHWVGSPARLELARELSVPDDAVAYAAADVLGKGRPQILYVSPGAVFALELGGAAASAPSPVRVLAEHRFLAPAASPGALPFWDGARDLDGDGLSDLLLPDARGYSVYRQHPAGALVRAGRVEFGVEYANEPSSRRRRRLSSEGPLLALRALPQVAAVDVNADGRADLIGLDDGELLAFAQGPELGFAREPSYRRALFAESARGAPLRRTRRPQLQHGDIDADGRVDFAVPELDLQELSTRLRIFLSGEAGPPEKPTQILKLSSLGDAPELIDVNGDGALDLGCPTVRTDRLRALATPGARRLDFSYTLFLFQPEQRAFSARPDLEWNVSVELPAEGESDAQSGADEARSGQGADAAAGESSDAREGENPARRGVISMGGDFDGDGARDLARLDARGELSVYRTRRAGRALELSAEPLLRAQERFTQDARFEDADGDGASDALLLYPDALVLLVSRS